MPDQVAATAEVELAGGIPFVSDADLESALADTDLPDDQVEAILDENDDARIVGLRASLFVLAIAALLALFVTRVLPTEAIAAPEAGSRRMSTGSAERKE